jgi:predicted aspartyl protease
MRMSGELYLVDRNVPGIAAVICVLVAAALSPVQPAGASEGWRKAPAPSNIRYRIIKDKVVALSNLSKPCGADIGVAGPHSPIEGKLVKREFSDDGIKLTGVVIESQSGERRFVNIDTFDSLQADQVNLADRGLIIHGLQTLLRQGANIAGEVQLCGVSGHIEMLDSVRLARGSRPEPEPSVPAESQTQKTPEASEVSVAMEAQAGTFVVPVQINGALTLSFTVDSGAAEVSIPADVVLTLTRTGTLTADDFLGEQTYQLADGSTVPSQTFVFRSLKVGDKILQNVTGSVAPVKGSLLLGQSFLSRFKSWSIDNQRHVLILD